MGTPHAEVKQIISLKGTHFTSALAQNAMETESISFPTDWATLGINDMIIEGLSITFEQAALEWDVYLFGNDTYNSTDVDAVVLYDQINFAAASGLQIAGAGVYHYASPTLEIPYTDRDRTSELHLGLVNRSATAKNAGATGEISLTFTVRPVYGV